MRFTEFNTKSNLVEVPVIDYEPLGFDQKGTQFNPIDKKLVQHPINKSKTIEFFENTPFDFRLFFNDTPGLRKYRESGEATPEQIKQIFGNDAERILSNIEDAITIIFIGNYGADKVMMTPWIMAHRFGHAIQAGVRKQGANSWSEAERHFFSTVNKLLENYYGKIYRGSNTYGSSVNWDLRPEYNALFNAIGTQRSSRTGQINRPYEFLYEIFAQYLGTGKITLNPLPMNLGYGRKVFGNPTKYMNLKPEYRDQNIRQQVTDVLSNDMEIMFNDVLSSSVGKIFLM